ncbi:MAG: ADP-ribosylglycohydrolase family protein [Rhodospirillales bacterium]|nr:MAG: ADP-ribosylglycohydrolase family protein [Rhodospirillales bacterium]
MLGAVTGDIIGSVWEGQVRNPRDAQLFSARSTFTDDTVCTIAVADWILGGAGDDLARTMCGWVRRYPGAGYGMMFVNWAISGGGEPYGSWGNGSAMRAAPCGWAGRDQADVLDLAARSARITHDHPNAVTAAEALALSVFLARRGADAQTVRQEITERFGYDLTRTPEAIRPRHVFDLSAAGTVPVALLCALCADSFENTMRNAIWLGGDTDTIACIAGAVAEPLFGLPPDIERETKARLDAPLRAVAEKFLERHGTG